MKLSDHTPIAYLWSISLASCNLKNWFRRFVPHITCNNNQFSTPEKENAHRLSLQSFELLLLLRSFVSGIVKKRALNQNKNTNIMLTEFLKIVFTPKNLGPPKSGALGLSLFSLMVNPRLSLSVLFTLCFELTWCNLWNQFSARFIVKCYTIIQDFCTFYYLDILRLNLNPQLICIMLSLNILK